MARLRAFAGRASKTKAFKGNGLFGARRNGAKRMINPFKRK
jgi:hypothetical protein